MYTLEMRRSCQCIPRRKRPNAFTHKIYVLTFVLACFAPGKKCHPPSGSYFHALILRALFFLADACRPCTTNPHTKGECDVVAVLWISAIYSNKVRARSSDRLPLLWESTGCLRLFAVVCVCLCVNGSTSLRVIFCCPSFPLFGQINMYQYA